MFDIQNYTSFVTAIILFQVIPGPGTLAILHAVARGGIRAGMGAVLGTLTGDFIYMLAAAGGVAAMLAASPALFSIMQWAGIAYLCRLGWSLLRTATGKGTAETPLLKSGWLYFRQAFAVSLTNPKVIMFFMAFFPLFMTTETKPLTLGIMMIHVTLLSFLYQAGLVFAGNEAARRVSHIKYLREIASRIAGLALIGFGLKLAFNVKR